MGSVLGWNVIGITRGDRTMLAPGPADKLMAGDRLAVEGRIETFE
jgi:K+/H+ antiporter YhaU regulatory subunit KhtT